MDAKRSGSGAASVLRRGGRALLILSALCMVCVLFAWGWTQLQINRNVQPVTQQEARQHYERALGWVRANESTVLSQGNAALWWMLDVAAHRSQDPYLTDLVDRYMARVFPGSSAQSPWARMVRPGTSINPDAPMEDGLFAYQRFFRDAIACRVGADTRPFFEEHVCRPSLTKVWLSDPACSTHQLMGLMIHRRSGCSPTPGVERLKAELLDDIAWQARLDPLMRDAGIQRVLMLAWAGDVSRPQPSWVRRVMAAQRIDGGWSGGETWPEWPEALQRDQIRALWARVRGQPLPAITPSGFHASAQGLLLMALLAHQPSDGALAP